MIFFISYLACSIYILTNNKFLITFEINLRRLLPWIFFRPRDFLRIFIRILSLKNLGVITWILLSTATGTWPGLLQFKMDGKDCLGYLTAELLEQGQGEMTLILEIMQDFFSSPSPILVVFKNGCYRVNNILLAI